MIINKCWIKAAAITLVLVLCLTAQVFAVDFDFSSLRNDTLKLGDDFFDSESNAILDPDRVIPIRSLLKDGENKNKAYYKSDGYWYEVFSLTEDQFLDPDYALEDESDIFSGNRWYKAGDEIEFITPRTVTGVEALPDIYVDVTTEPGDIPLPDKVEITISDGTEIYVAVEWDKGQPEYVKYTGGIYVFSGELIMPGGLTNPGNKNVTARVLSYIPNIDPNPDTPLNTSQGTTIYGFDDISELRDTAITTVELDEINFVSGAASLRLSSSQPLPNTGTDTEYFSVVTDGNLGGMLGSMESIEFNLYIPDKYLGRDKEHRIDYLLVKFYTDENHNVFFENGIGDWELCPGWNKIRRIKEDFNFVNSIDSGTSGTMMLKAGSYPPDEREILQQKIDHLNSVISAQRPQSRGMSLQSTGEPSWDNITRMELYVVSKKDTHPGINIDRISFNTQGRAMLLFTFDDAWQDVLINGKPILDAAGFKATTWVNKEASTDIYPDNPVEVFMSIEELTDIYEKGWDIGNHTDHHPDNLLSIGEMRKEYLDNQNWILENGWERGAHHVCYPSGQYSEELIEMLQDIGVKSGRTVVYGIQPTPVHNIYKLKCAAVGRDTDIKTHVLDEIDRAVSTGSTLFLMLHRVEETPEPDDGGENYGQIAVSIENLQTIVDHAKDYVDAGKLEVVTISDWYKAYTGIDEQ